MIVDFVLNFVSSDLWVDIIIGEGGNFRISMIEIMIFVGCRVYCRIEVIYDGDNWVNINVLDL